MQRLFLIAGETSGDTHGASLIKALNLLDNEIHIQAWGGNEMKKAGAQLVHHIDELSIMGFTQVLWNLRKIKSWFSLGKNQISSFEPDAIIFIDFAGFNLRMAKWAKSQGYATFYFIPPKTWAWNESRIQALQKNIDFIIPILPFEQSYFKSKGLKVGFFGNPLHDVVQNFRHSHPDVEEKTNKTIGMFPGSRKQELKYILPVFRKIIQSNPKLNFRISAISSIGHKWYQQVFEGLDSSNYSVEYDNAYEILNQIDKAICTSGTITLEAALFNVPQVVVYKTNWVNYNLAKHFIKTSFISLPNLILNEAIVPELLQNQCNAANIIQSLEGLNGERVVRAYSKLTSKLNHKDCIEKIALFVLRGIKEKKAAVK